MTSEPVFQVYGSAHLVVIALTILLPLVLAGIARQFRTTRFTDAVCWLLAGLLFFNWIGFAVFRFAKGQFDPARELPMQLCDWATATTILALLTRRQVFYELSYFWGLAATFQAILTPDLRVPFPDPGFINFFVCHSGIVIGVLFMTLGMKFRPGPFSVFRTLLWSEVYLAAALSVNWAIGANYGFLTHRPEGASLLDYLSSKRPLYILEMNVLAVLFFAVLYVPFAFGSRDAVQRR